MEIDSEDLLTVPELAAAPPEPSVLRFVTGDLQRPETGLLYRFSLMIVAAAMTLLPVLYCGLVGLFGYSIYYYAVHFASILAWPFSGVIGLGLKFFLYFGPLFAGFVLTLFLIKPLFAPQRATEEHLSLNHADAPQLFVLIGWVCRSLDAPIPSRIDIDCSVNASAGFRSGVRSLFDNDIVLTIGLPLVAGMNLGQFAVVIAHEYGHFSQGTAMRASYIIGRINHWFYRVVYERDAWDVTLAEAGNNAENSLLAAGFLAGANLGVWFGRGILWVFLMASGLLSSFMSRQMEFNADAYAIKTAGSQAFLSTTRRLRQLGLGSAVALQQLMVKWKTERKLFDQIPHFIVSRADEIPAGTQDQYYTAAFRRKTRLFDVHPSDAERLQRAVEANEPGIFHSTWPAASLFTNFSELSRRITLAHYEYFCGPEFRREWLLPTEQTAAQAGHDDATDLETIGRYFFGIVAGPRPMMIAENKSLNSRSPEALVAESRETRQHMLETLPAAKEAQAAFVEANSRWLRARQAQELFRAGFGFDPADFAVAELNLDTAIEDAQQALLIAGSGLQPFVDAGLDRLRAGLLLLASPPVARHLPNAVKLQDETREMIWVLSRLETTLALLPGLRRDCAVLEVILQYRAEQLGADNLKPTLATLCACIQNQVKQIQEHTSQLRYPFRHATEQVFVGEYARNKEYHPDPVEQVLREGRSHAEKITALHHRLLATLIVIAEQVEAQIDE